MQRLEDLNSASPESTCADTFIDQIENPKHNHVVKSLKTTTDVTFEDCHSKVLSKIADVVKPKPKDANALTPRSVGIKTPSPPKLAKEKIHLEAYKKEDSTIYLPHATHGSLTDQVKKELNKCNAAVRRNKRKACELATPLLPSLEGTVNPRSNNVAALN